MFFKRKKSSADKAFELCVDLLGEIRKQGKAIDALAEEIKGIKGTLAGMEEFLTEEVQKIKEEQTNLYATEKVTQDSVSKLGLKITELKNGVMAYEQKKEDAVTTAQIIDEFLNGGKDEQ